MEQMGNIFGYLNDFITLLNTIKIYFWCFDCFLLLPLSSLAMFCVNGHHTWNAIRLSSAITLETALDSKGDCWTHLSHTSHIAEACSTLTGPALFLCHQSVWDICLHTYVPTIGIRQRWCRYVAPLWKSSYVSPVLVVKDMEKDMHG